jgi:CRP-like cAMP-binding protein
LILSDKELLETLYLADGQILFHRGDPGDALYLIEAGHLRIFTLDRDGKEITLNTMSAGETLGEMALLDGQPRSASAIAIGSCTVLRLKRDDFLMQIHHSPISIESIIQLLSERARHMTSYIEQLGHWARLIVDGQYNQVIEIVEQLDPEGDRALVAVADSLKEMVKAVQEREESLRHEIIQLRSEIEEQKRKQKEEAKSMKKTTSAGDNQQMITEDPDR